MGAFQIPPLQLSGEFQKEFSSLSRERDSEMFYSGLLTLGRRLEDADQVQTAAEVYSAIGTCDLPELRARAQQRLDSILGKGAFAPRFEFLLKRFAKDSTDYRMILPMLAATAVSGVVRAGALGRLLGAGSEAWYGHGLAARGVASGLALAVEAPTFALSARALRSTDGAAKGERNLGEDILAAGLSLGCLKLFGFAGEEAFSGLHAADAFGAPSRWLRISGYSRALLSQTSMLAGLLTSQRLEEKMGLRAPVDGATEMTDAFSSLLSLGVGARLGERILGSGVSEFQNELNLRARLLEAVPRARRTTAWARSWLLSPMWMAMGVGGGGFDAGSPPEAKHFPSYRRLTSLTLLGDLLHNVERRLAESPRPVRILELGVGQEEVAQELKRRFGDRLQIETNHRAKRQEEVSDRHYDGDFLDAPLEGSYDLILSIDGPHAFHGGKLVEMLQKAFDHLTPEGEFIAAVRPASLSTGYSQLRDFENFPKIREAIGRGLAFRIERLTDRYAIYGRRLGESQPLDLKALLAERTQSLPKASSDRVQALRKAMLSHVFRLRDQSFTLPERSIQSLSDHLTELGWSEDANRVPELAQFLIDRFLEEYGRDHSHPPDARDIQRWSDGEEPSAFLQKTLLLEELIRWESQELRRKLAGKGSAVLAIGLGLSALLHPGSAEAATHGMTRLHEASNLHWLAPLGLGALGMMWGHWPYGNFWSFLRYLVAESWAGFKERLGAPDRSSDPPPSPRTLRPPDSETSVKTNKVVDFPLNDLPKPIFYILAEDEAPPESIKVKLLPEEAEEDEEDREEIESRRLGLVPHGWVKQQRRRVLAFLANPKVNSDDKVLTNDNLVRYLRRTQFRPSELTEVTSLFWELCFHPQLDSETRDWTWDDYLKFLRHSKRFPKNAPQVYREALRLRRIFSNTSASLEKRIRAAEAYHNLLPKFNFQTPVGKGEASMGAGALQDFLDEGRVPRGTADYYYVNSGLVYLQDNFLRKRTAGKEE